MLGGPGSIGAELGQVRRLGKARMLSEYLEAERWGGWTVGGCHGIQESMVYRTLYPVSFNVS